jgi:YesN/AraC family two-component response regulator
LVGDFSRLDEAYSTAFATAEECSMHGAPAIRAYSSITRQAFELPTTALKLVNNIGFGIKRRDSQAVRDGLEHLLGHMSETGMHSYMIRLLYSTVADMMENALFQYGGGTRHMAHLPVSMSVRFDSLKDSLRAVCAELCDYIDEENGQIQRSDISLAELEAYINENFASSAFSIQLLADHFNTTASNMSYLFKRKTGVGYKQYIDYLRIELANKLLARPEMTVEEIAASVGYDNPSSFIRIYKNLSGITPGTFRKNNAKRI